MGLRIWDLTLLGLRIWASAHAAPMMAACAMAATKSSLPRRRWSAIDSAIPIERKSPARTGSAASGCENKKVTYRPEIAFDGKNGKVV